MPVKPMKSSSVSRQMSDGVCLRLGPDGLAHRTGKAVDDHLRVLRQLAVGEYLLTSRNRALAKHSAPLPLVGSRPP